MVQLAINLSTYQPINLSTYQPINHAPPLPTPRACNIGLQPGRNCQLCILALPADMGFAELCAFMGAYFQHVGAARCAVLCHAGLVLCCYELCSAVLQHVLL